MALKFHVDFEPSPALTADAAKALVAKLSTDPDAAGALILGHTCLAIKIVGHALAHARNTEQPIHPNRGCELLANALVALAKGVDALKRIDSEAYTHPYEYLRVWMVAEVQRTIQGWSNLIIVDDDEVITIQGGWDRTSKEACEHPDGRSDRKPGCHWRKSIPTVREIKEALFGIAASDHWPADWRFPEIARWMVEQQKPKLTDREIARRLEVPQRTIADRLNQLRDAVRKYLELSQF